MAAKLALSVRELSAGELQRALFARLILQDAAIILLDEPLAAVDAPTASVLLEQMMRWHEEGRTVIAVLHDLVRVRAHFPSTLVLARRCLAWGRYGGGVARDGGVMSVHALFVEPFETLGFMRTALVACLALALSNGAVGTLLILRRMSLDGQVLGYAVMPGAAIGFLYAGPSQAWLSLGGLASGFAVAALAGLIAGERARRDVGLVAFYLIALSLGVLLVAWRGSNVEIMRVLFGTVLAIDRGALLQIAAASSVIVLLIAALYRPLAVGAFDPAFLRLAGARGALWSGVLGFGGRWRWSRASKLLAHCWLWARCCCRRRRRGAGGWEWQHRSRWRSGSDWPHPWRDCWSPTTAMCRPGRRSC